jgi:nucleoside-diphosphate-sugar epimerase
VGQRLVEMLIERGANKVISFDIAPKPKDGSNRPEIEYIQGDMDNTVLVSKICSGVECVFHVATFGRSFIYQNTM